MAVLFISRSSRSSISSQSIINGQITICDDSKEIFYDNGNTVRVLTDSITTIATENDRITMQSPKENMVYIVNESNTIYRYRDGVWSTIIRSDEIADLVTVYTEMTTATLYDHDKPVAPRTLASCVYTKSGDRVEDYIRNITSIGMTSGKVTATMDNQSYFNIPIPFEGYLTGGNHVLVIYKGALVPLTDYSVDNTTTQLYYSKGLKKDEQLDLIFLYHSKIPAKSNNYVDGGYITDGTIRTKKLSKVSNSYELSDPSSIATSQAVSALHDALSARLDKVSPMSLVHATAQGDAYEIYLSIPGYVLSDGNMLIVRTTTPLARNCKVKINGLDAVPIYIDENPIDENMVESGKNINLLYNAADSRFYLTNGEIYKIKKSVTTYTAKAGDMIIDIGNDAFVKDTDDLEVFQQNTPLFENVNYTIKNGKIYLIDYSADEGDVFIFVIRKIVKNFE